MNFTLDDDQKLLQETVRRFAQKELPALARDLEERDDSVNDDWMRRYADMGFTDWTSNRMRPSIPPKSCLRNHADPQSSGRPV